MTLPSLFTILACEMIVSILIDNLHLLFAIFVITFWGLLMNEKIFQSSRLQQSVGSLICQLSCHKNQWPPRS